MFSTFTWWDNRDFVWDIRLLVRRRRSFYVAGSRSSTSKTRREAERRGSSKPESRKPRLRSEWRTGNTPASTNLPNKAKCNTKCGCRSRSVADKTPNSHNRTGTNKCDDHRRIRRDTLWPDRLTLERRLVKLKTVGQSKSPIEMAMRISKWTP